MAENKSTPDGITILKTENTNSEPPLCLKVVRMFQVTATNPRLTLSDGSGNSTEVYIDSENARGLIADKLITLGSYVKVLEWAKKKENNGNDKIFIRNMQTLDGRSSSSLAASSRNGNTSNSNGDNDSKGSAKKGQRPDPKTVAAAERKIAKVKVKDITQDISSNAKIEVKLISIGTVRQWGRQGKRGGNVANIELMGTCGTSIRATLFNAECDKFIPTLKPDKWYEIRGVSAKIADEKYKVYPHRYELSFGQHTEMNQIPDQQSTEDLTNFVFQTLEHVKYHTEVNTVLDVVAVLLKVDSTMVKTKQRQEPTMRTVLTLGDATDATLELTLWDTLAKSCSEWSVGDTIIAKNIRTSQYNQLQKLGATVGSVLSRNPPVLAAQKLRDFYSAGMLEERIEQLNGSRPPKDGGEWKTLADIAAEDLGAVDGRDDYFRAIGIFTNIYHTSEKPSFYFACGADAAAEAKLASLSSSSSSNGSGVPMQKRCAKSARENVTSKSGWDPCPHCKRSFDRPTPRFMMKARIADHTSSVFVSVSSRVAENSLLKVSAEQLHQWALGGKMDEIARVLEGGLHRQVQMKLRARSENMQNQTRIVIEVVDVAPIDYDMQIERLSI